MSLCQSREIHNTTNIETLLTYIKTFFMITRKKTKKKELGVRLWVYTRGAIATVWITAVNFAAV